MNSFVAKIHRRHHAAPILLLLTCFLGVSPASPTARSGLIEIGLPWCLAAGPRANSAGYLVIENKGYTADSLTAVTSPAAQSVTIHESRTTAGLSTMSEVGSLEIPARASVIFAPGGLHIMLEALRRPLIVGEKVPVTLWFKVYGPVRTGLVVMLTPPVHSKSRPMQM